MLGLKERLLRHLEEIAFFLELQEENVFKSRAFKGGEEAISGLTDEELADRIQKDTLTELKGIGKGISSCAKYLLETETSTEWKKVRGVLPASLFELRDISGLGPKKIMKIYEISQKYTEIAEMKNRKILIAFFKIMKLNATVLLVGHLVAVALLGAAINADPMENNWIKKYNISLLQSDWLNQYTYALYWSVTIMLTVIYIESKKT